MKLPCSLLKKWEVPEVLLNHFPDPLAMALSWIKTTFSGSLVTRGCSHTLSALVVSTVDKYHTISLKWINDEIFFVFFLSF